MEKRIVDVDKVLRRLSAIISAYHNGEIETSGEETEQQATFRLLRRAVLGRYCTVCGALLRDDENMECNECFVLRMEAPDGE